MKTFADVNDPDIRPLADAVKANNAMVSTIISLHQRYGMGVTDYYADGVVRVAEGDGMNDLCCFVRPNGTFTRITTYAANIFLYKMKVEREEHDALERAFA